MTRYDIPEYNKMEKITFLFIKLISGSVLTLITLKFLHRKKKTFQWILLQPNSYLDPHLKTQTQYNPLKNCLTVKSSRGFLKPAI